MGAALQTLSQQTKCANEIGEDLWAWTVIFNPTLYSKARKAKARFYVKSRAPRSVVRDRKAGQGEATRQLTVHITLD
jgi:hypothetical protein